MIPYDAQFRIRLAAFSRRIAEGEDGESKGKRGGPPPGWQKFVDQKLKGRKVPNPDKDSSRKEILITTAMKKDKSIYDKVMKEYAEWAKKQKSLGKKKPSTNKEKETKDNKKIRDMGVLTFNEQTTAIEKFKEAFKSPSKDLEFGTKAIAEKAHKLAETYARDAFRNLMRKDTGSYSYKVDLPYLAESYAEESKGKIKDKEFEQTHKELVDSFIQQARKVASDQSFEIPEKDLKQVATAYANRVMFRSFVEATGRLS